jgi:hypothetical protein
MNTVKVLSQPLMRITNLWHIRLMAFHQNMGLVYFALLAAMPLLGGSLMARRPDSFAHLFGKSEPSRLTGGEA